MLVLWNGVEWIAFGSLQVKIWAQYCKPAAGYTWWDYPANHTVIMVFMIRLLFLVGALLFMLRKRSLHVQMAWMEIVQGLLLVEFFTLFLRTPPLDMIAPYRGALFAFQYLWPINMPVVGSITWGLFALVTQWLVLRFILQKLPKNRINVRAVAFAMGWLLLMGACIWVMHG